MGNRDFFDMMDLMDCVYFLNTINGGLSLGDALVGKDTRELLWHDRAQRGSGRGCAYPSCATEVAGLVGSWATATSST